MSMKYYKLIQGALFSLAILLGALLVNPASYAGGALMLMPEEDRDVPEGSYISEQRIKAIEKKVEVYKEILKAKNLEQQALPQDNSRKSH